MTIFADFFDDGWGFVDSDTFSKILRARIRETHAAYLRGKETMKTYKELAEDVRRAWLDLAKAVLAADGEGLRVTCDHPGKVFERPFDATGKEIVIVKEF